MNDQPMGVPDYVELFRAILDDQDYRFIRDKANYYIDSLRDEGDLGEAQRRQRSLALKGLILALIERVDMKTLEDMQVSLQRMVEK